MGGDRRQAGAHAYRYTHTQHAGTSVDVDMHMGNVLELQDKEHKKDVGRRHTIGHLRMIKSTERRYEQVYKYVYL